MPAVPFLPGSFNPFNTLTALNDERKKAGYAPESNPQNKNMAISAMRCAGAKILNERFLDTN